MPIIPTRAVRRRRYVDNDFFPGGRNEGNWVRLNEIGVLGRAFLD
jgi:hypothetical protein